MPLRRKRKSRIKAPAVVLFTQGLNPKGEKQLCVYAQCTYGGTTAGPIWGHTDQSVRRCLATLTKQCDCGRTYHHHKYTEGFRVRGKPEAP